MPSFVLRLRHRMVFDHGDDGGMGLIELIVALGLAALLSTLATIWFVGAHRISADTTSGDLDQADARNVLQNWSQFLQSAVSSTVPGQGVNRITALTPTSITFTSNLTNKPTCANNTLCTNNAVTTITLALSGSRLAQTVNGVTRPVTTGSSVSSSGCLFTPYTAAGTALACTGLSPVQLSTVASVTLAFSTGSGNNARAFQTSASFASAS